MSTLNRLAIKDWAEEDRPREKLLSKGVFSLSNAELLAILIGSGNREETAVELSMRILNSVNNNLDELGKLSVHDLKSKFKGIGDAKAISIIAAVELGKRRGSSEMKKQTQIKSSQNIYEVFHPLLCDLVHEEFWILLLNRSNKIIDKKRISSGGITGTVVDTRLILKTALDQLATGLAVCHNHPSGNLKPSRSDIETTKKIKNACQAVDILFLDHIIIGKNNYFSFADEGLL